MKSTKTLIILIVAAVLVVGSVLAIVLVGGNNGNNGHQHQYSAEVVDPTCSAGGYTKYTCACGHTYNGNQVAALRHTNTTTYEYPTVNEAGSKTSVCSVCGHEETVVLDAMVVSSPKVSKFLAKFIGAVAYSVEIGENSTVVYVSDSDNEDVTPDSRDTLTIKVAEAAISGKDDDLKGHLVLDLTETESDSEDVSSAKISIYVNGDNVSIDITSPAGETIDKDINLTEILYEAIGEKVGMDSDTLIETYYLIAEAFKSLPLAGGVIESVVNAIPELSETCGQSVIEMFGLVGQNIIVETANPDGSTTYTVDLVALKQILDIIELDKTFEEYVVSMFGEATAADIFAFVESLPDRTVREISEAIVEIAENTGASIDDLYYVVDLIAYKVGNVEISIEREIYDRYDKTLIEIIAEANGVTGEEAEAFIETIRTGFAETVTTVKALSLESVITGYIAPDAEGELTFIEDAKAMIEQYASFVSVEFTVDADGKLISLDADIAGSVAVNLVYDNDAYTVTLTLANGAQFIVVCGDSSFVIQATMQGALIFSGELDVEETTEGDDTITTITGNIDSGAIEGSLEISYTTRDGVIVGAGIDAEIVDVEYSEVVFKAEAGFTTDADGVIDSFNANIGDGAIVVDYANVEGVSTVTFALPGETVIVISYTDTSFSLVATVEGEEVASGEITVEETTEGAAVTTTVTGSFESLYFGIVTEISQTLTDGVITNSSVSIVAKDEEDTEVYSFIGSADYTDDSVALDLYAETFGDVVLDGNVTIETTESDSKDTYVLTIDFDKIFISSYAESAPDNGDYSPVVPMPVEASSGVTVDNYLDMDMVITFSCEK